MAKPPRVHGRGLDTFCQEELATTARDVECTTLGPRKLLSICRSRLVALHGYKIRHNLALLQYASWSESLLGGGPFIVLRSRGISQIYHTYSEDICTPYILLVGVVYPIHVRHKPRLKPRGNTDRNTRVLPLPIPLFYYICAVTARQTRHRVETRPPFLTHVLKEGRATPN